MTRIVVLDKLSEEGLQVLDTAGLAYDVRTGLKGDDLRAALAEYDGAICRSGVKITAKSLEGNRRLRAIVRAGVGTDNIDKQAATRLGIVVMNTPTGNTISTAEHAFALLLALSRNIAPAYQSLVEGRWDRSDYMGAQVADKTLGIVGLGRIGREVATRAVAFQMRVLAFDPFLSDEQAATLGIRRVATVAEMLPEIDYLTVHTPLTPETQNLINADNIERLKRGARLINCARGGIYDEQALVDGLRSGHLGGVALDVYRDEPCTDSPLFGMPGVVCTPHLGASTEEAQTQVAVEAAQLLSSYLLNGEIRHAVNMAAVDPQTLADLRGYLDLAYRLGRLLAQLHGGGADECSLLYRGAIAKKDHRLITSAFCAGLLDGAMDEEVNIVNASMLLSERGVKLTEQTDSAVGMFSSSMTAELQVRGQRHTASGTLFGTKMPRLVQLHDYRLEAYLDGKLMIFTHDDVPGIVGHVGTIFGRHRVNIAQMTVGRAGDAPGGNAVGILNLDDMPSSEALAEVLALPHIHSARLIDLPPAGVLPRWLS